MQNGGPSPHRKFQHFSSIRKCLKIGGTFKRVKVSPRQAGDEIQYSPSLNLFQHASWQGSRIEKFGRKKGLLVLTNDLSNIVVACKQKKPNFFISCSQLQPVTQYSLLSTNTRKDSLAYCEDVFLTSTMM